MLSKEGNTYIQLSLPELSGFYRVIIFSVNPQIVDQIVKEAIKTFPKIGMEVDRNTTIDNGKFGKEVQLHKMSGMDRAVGLWIFGFLQMSGWDVQQSVIVNQGTHIMYQMIRNEVGIQNK